jgi:hypothetical protein
MRIRWLVLVVVASLCLNVAVVGTYFFRRARHNRSRRLSTHGLPSEAREGMRRAREAAMPEFSALVGRVESTDSLLWTEMSSQSPDSARVESLCQELGQFHGRMRAMVFRQMHRELQMMPAAARAEYLKHMMQMRPGFGGPGPGRGGHMNRGHGMGRPHDDEPPPGGPPEPPPNSGK